MARGPTVQLKVFVLSAGLLLLAEAVTLATIYATIRSEVDRNIATQLDVGREVFRAQFDARLRYLAVYSRLLGKDFGLLSTLHDDPKSLLVAVNNHRGRVGADLAIVTDADGLILADTAQPERAGERFALARAVREDRPNASLFVDTGSAVYQLAAAPLQAPNTIGWIYLGFVVDDGLARQFESITGLQVSFLGPAPGGELRVIASTLDPARRGELAARGHAAALERVHDARLAGEDYIGLGLKLQADGSSFAVLHRSRDAALAAYAPWWISISEVVAGALLLALFGAWAVARSIARPIGVLVEQARAIGRGNYTEPIALREGGEIGELADEFNQMQHAIAEREDSIRYNAWHDTLTGLANRGRLESLVDERIRGAPRDERRLALLIVDLDRFKDINETLGYHAGDRLLREVGERLRAAMPGDAVVARLGGAEFGVLLEGVALGALHPAVDALCNTLMRPYLAEGLELYLTVTVGTAVFPDHGNDAGALLRHADAARFAAKERRLRHVVYEGTQDRYSLLRVSLLGELRSAMARGDLTLHYQPKLDLDSDLVRTVEALVRWQHPTYGAIPPSEFIPMVEHTGNITMLTSWVLRTALEQLAAWDAEGITLDCAVNVSAYDLRHAELLDTIMQALAETGLKPQRLTLELTESAVVEELAQVRKALAQLDALGCRIAIDDYGTGYSSLAQLKRLPVDELKIDQSFVSVVDRNPDDETIVRSTIDLGHNMGLKVVAEGVETPQVLRVLRRLGCDTVQGYLLSKPVAAAALADWLRAREWRALAEVRA